MSGNEIAALTQSAFTEGFKEGELYILKKLKTEINSEDVNCQYEEDYVYSSGLQKTIEIIDKHIKELKGE